MSNIESIEVKCNIRIEYFMITNIEILHVDILRNYSRDNRTTIVRLF